MASCSLSNPGFQGPLIIHKSQFLGQTHITLLPQRTISSTYSKSIPTKPATIRAKFDLAELLGGRGLCNGEVGLQEELKKEVESPTQNPGNPSETSGEKAEELAKTNTELAEIPDDVFEKELFGLTGGFPGGEKGLQKFIEGNGLPDIIKGKKREKIEFLPKSIKIRLPELKLKLPQLSSPTRDDRDR